MGRTHHSGPVSGAYKSFMLVPFAAAATPGAVTSTYRVQLPSAFRLDEVTLATQSSAGGASRPTVQITDGTNNLFSGAVSLVSAGGVAVTPTSSPSLVAAQRSRAKGDILQIQITTVASEVVTGLVIVIAGHNTGDIVALEAND